MTYEELIIEINIKDTHTYTLMLHNLDILLLQIAKSNQGVVARALSMDRTKLSLTLSVLKELQSNGIK